MRVGCHWRGLPSPHPIPWCRSLNILQLVLELRKYSHIQSFTVTLLTTPQQIIAIITPYLVDAQYANLSSKIFFMWGSLCIISVLFAYFLVPETKGLSLEQVDKMLEEVTPRKSRGWVPHSTFAAEMGLVEKGIPAPTGIGGGVESSAEETELEAIPANKEVV